MSEEGVDFRETAENILKIAKNIVSVFRDEDLSECVTALSMAAAHTVNQLDGSEESICMFIDCFSHSMRNFLKSSSLKRLDSCE